MKIAIDIRTTAGEKTGKGFYTFHIVKNLLELDKKNTYTLYTKDKVAGFDEYKNATIKEIKGKLLWHHKVAKDVHKMGADIFFAPTSYITPTLIKPPTRTVITIHDLVAFLFPEDHNYKATLIERFYLKKALRSASKIVTVSENTADDVIKKFDTDPEKITTIYNSADENYEPVDRALLTKFIQQTNLPKNFFLAVGTLIPRKNYPTLIRAFQRLQKSHPNHHLIIVGGKGWKSDEIKQTKNVHFLGYLSTKSLKNLYNLATALVFPSFYEGFGIPPLEAMRCGCPVIASNNSSIPEVVGNAGILINPESAKEIEHAMHELITSEIKREKLIANGFEQAKKFSWKDSAKKLLELFSQIK